MVVLFTRGRLHVGFRRRDWTDVWYEPAGDADSNGGRDIGLFRLTTGDREREPQPGEVHWHPAFDVNNCESKTFRERLNMQRQFLADAHEYLAELDVDRVRELEEQLHDRHFIRWDKWFEHAKKYKRTKMKQRESRRNKGKESDSAEDAEDSTYQSEAEQQRNAQTAAERMPPPDHLPNKRKRAKTLRDGRKAISKKFGSKSSFPHGRRPSPMFMSGGLGEPAENEDVEDDHAPRYGPDRTQSGDELEDMDTRDPYQLTSATTGIPSAFTGFIPPTPLSWPRIRATSVGNSSLHSQSPTRRLSSTVDRRARVEDEEVNDNEVDDPSTRQYREQSFVYENDDEAEEAAKRLSLELHQQQSSQNGAVATTEGADGADA